MTHFLLRFFVLLRAKACASARFAMVVMAVTCTDGAWHAAPAFAANPTGFIAGDSRCPDPVAVEAEVFRLTSAELRAEHLPGASVRVTEGDDSYHIEIRKGDQEFVKTYSDPARECDKRVRFAAVYVVMTLMPPDFGDPSQKQTTGPTSSQPDAEQAGTSDVGTNTDVEQNTPGAGSNESGTTEQSVGGAGADEPAAQRDEKELGSDDGARLWALELGLTGAHSWSTSQVPRIATWGGELQAELGLGSVRVVAAVEVAPHARFDIRGVLAKMLAVNMRSGVRLAQDTGKLAFFADAQLVASWKRVEGESSLTSEPVSVWEWGALLGFTAGYRWHPALMPLLGVRASFFPAPSQLEALPRGELGKLPKLWLGGVLGVRF